MRVYFDEQIFVTQEHGGISRYYAELARALAMSGTTVHLFGGITRNRYLASLNPTRGLTVRFRQRRDRLRINKAVAALSRAWRRWDFARFSRGQTRIVYHATNYDVDPWIARRADLTCLTIFDLIGELMCDSASRIRSLERKARSLPFADLLFCISEQTRRDFLAEFPDCQSRATVTYLAASLPPPDPDAVTAATNLRPYLLLVGNRAGYKNGAAAFQAFSLLARKYPSLRLVCFGGEALSSKEMEGIASAGAQSRVSRESGGDAALAAYYSQALALVYPSRYEGFGLPLLEAMGAGCPVVTTRCASLPEVGGEAAIYVGPEDTEGIMKACERLLEEPSWRQSWVEAGRKRARDFSWTQTALHSKAAYERGLSARVKLHRALK